MKSGTKIAVITGSAGGLGKEFAEKLLASGQQKYRMDNQISTELSVNDEAAMTCFQRLLWPNQWFFQTIFRAGNIADLVFYVCKTCTVIKILVMLGVR